MPIKPIVLQRRLAEVGRIRIGQVVKTKNGKTAPSKLDRLRFTSASQPLIATIAEAYGGEAAEWTPANGGAAQWEVITDVDRVPVIVPPQSVSQYMEAWSGGGCQRRCDGESELLSGGPCICAAEDSMVCQPTTRLSVMLRDIPGLGVWRLESKGWNAAAELPDTAEFLARAGGYIGASLYLKARRVVSGGRTKDFMVPALEVEGVTPAQLLAGNAGPAALTGQERAAIEAGPGRDFVAEIGAATTRDKVVEIWEAAKTAAAAGQWVDAAAVEAAARARVAALETAAPPADDTPAEGQAPSIDDLWMQIVMAWPGDSTAEIETAFAKRYEGLLPDSADAAQLAEFLAAVNAGQVTA